VPLSKNWNRRENAKAAHEIVNANNINVGLLCFDGVVVIDRDVNFRMSVEHMKSLSKTVKVIRSNAPKRGALIYRVIAPEGGARESAPHCGDGRGASVYSETYRPQPDAAPTMELIAMNPNGTAKHKVVAGNYRGGRYELHDTRYGIREITLAELDVIWQRNVNVRLKQCVEQELAASQPQKHQETGSFPNGDLAQRMRQTWSAYDVFEYHGFTGDIESEPGGNLRILGHGGLIVGGHGPNAWRWYCFADDTGGDIFDAWSYCTIGAIVDRTDPESFRSVLTAMADATGVQKKETSAPKGLPS
jgi:hypothetical protein